MQNDKNQSLPDRSDGGGDAVRKAFMFYTNWFEDTADALSREEQGDFFRTIVRYASRGELPGDDVSPIVKSMFGLVRNVIDANTEKYDKIVEKNRQRSAKSAEKRAAQSKKAKKEKTVDNEQFSASEQILDTRYLIQETKNMLFEDEKERTKESLERDLVRDGETGAAASARNMQVAGADSEARGPETGAVAETAAAPEVPSREEVKAYWRERNLKSDWQEFYSYYNRMEWRNVKGQRLRSWKSAAFFWEEKFRKDVLPAIRRTAAAESQAASELRAKTQAAENERFRAEARAAFAAEAAERSAKAASPEMSRYMYDRALEWCSGDADRAIELLKQSADNPTLYARLTDGYSPTTASS